MRPICIVVLALVACLAVLVSGAANAQARRESSSELKRPKRVVDPAEVEAARAAKLAELEVWLKRLVGRFRYEGDLGEVIAGHNGDPVYSRSNARGVADCVGFGEGPGVQCVIKVTWPPTRRYDQSQVTNNAGVVGSPAAPGVAEYWVLNPAMSLYGIDPDNLGIRYLQVNGKSIAEGGLGVLRDDVVTFGMLCRTLRGPGFLAFCRQSIRITAKLDLKVIRIDIEQRGTDVTYPGLFFHFVLHRVPEREPKKASSAP